MRRAGYQLTDLFDNEEVLEAGRFSVGDKILDNQGRETRVTWCRKYPKEKRLLVDLHVKARMLPVTGSHWMSHRIGPSAVVLINTGLL